MLDILRRIVQEVSAAADLEEALRIIVSRIKSTMDVDVCSVYLADTGFRRYMLMASDGLDGNAVGNVAIPVGRGLVSLVGEREEPLNIANAPQHPRYYPLPGGFERADAAFLGVPIVHRRRVMGILVVRRAQARPFSEEQVSLLVTMAAQLAAAIAHAEASGETAKLITGQTAAGSFLEGVRGAPGVALGQVLVVYPPADLDAVPDRRVRDIDQELAIFRAAVERVRAELEALERQLGGTLTRENRALFDAYQLMLNSDSLIGRTEARIRAGSWASGALRDTVKEQCKTFAAMTDPYLKERVNDVRDLGQRILMSLQSGKRSAPPYPEKTVLVANEMSATMLAEVPPDRLVGVVSVKGSSSSHVAILARAMGIPAVVGVDDLPVSRVDGCAIVVDGYRGRIYLSPGPAIRAEYERLKREEEEIEATLAELGDLPSVTPDGVHIPLYANTGLVADITPCLNSGACGIGLYRTEFPFMIRDRFPGENEQTEIYREVLSAFNPRPVTLRTLDIGGDKPLDYFPINEANPFLGWRGLRVTLDHPEIFLVQIRAMLRASDGLGNLRILLPMVSTVAELDQAIKLIWRAHKEVLAEGYHVALPFLGVMVEVPSTVYLIDAVAQRVDFISVGSNDLTQYLLAVDRNNPRVAQLYDSLHPAVLMAIRHVASSVHKHGKTTGVCGEMAGDPAGVLALIGLGVDSLSMSAANVGRIKKVVRTFSRRSAQSIVDAALAMENAEEVRQLLEQRIEEAGLGGLIRAGK